MQKVIREMHIAEDQCESLLQRIHELMKSPTSSDGYRLPYPNKRARELNQLHHYILLGLVGSVDIQELRIRNRHMEIETEDFLRFLKRIAHKFISTYRTEQKMAEIFLKLNWIIVLVKFILFSM